MYWTKLSKIVNKNYILVIGVKNRDMQTLDYSKHYFKDGYISK